MPRIELAPQVFDNFDRFFAYMAELGAAADPPQRIDEIIEAVDLLAHSPLIGRKVKAGNRELVIGRASHGYVALHRFLPDIDTVFALAFRGRREAGYKRDASQRKEHWPTCPTSIAMAAHRSRSAISAATGASAR